MFTQTDRRNNDRETPKQPSLSDTDGFGCLTREDLKKLTQKETSGFLQPLTIADFSGSPSARQTR